jgi:chromosomal replication initiation ATPase DnaA
MLIKEFEAMSLPAKNHHGARSEVAGAVRSRGFEGNTTGLGPIRAIAMAEAREAGIRLEQILGSSRERRLVKARWAAMWRAHQAGFSPTEIGRAFGGRDHTTVLSAL